MAEFSGHLSLNAAARPHGRTVLAGQSFRAPYHVSKPYWDPETGVLLVQVVNPTAGILEGDRLESRIAVEPGGALLVTAPSASRVFRMRAGTAECRQHFLVAAGGWLEVMPEPLVPHQGSRYRQTTDVEVAEGGRLFFVDQLMPGRIGHGEAWGWDRLSLELTVRAGGQLVLRERMDQSGPELRALSQLAGTGEAACFANAILIAPDLPAGEAPWVRPVASLHGADLWLGVSALRAGGWSLKFVARDSRRLREGLREARRLLSQWFPQLGCDPRKL